MTQSDPAAGADDARAFLQQIYRDEAQPLKLRMEAAKLALAHERPAPAGASAGGIDAPPKESFEEWEARRRRELAALEPAAAEAED